MVVKVKYIAEAGHRRAVTPAFYESFEEYMETLPAYTARRVTEASVYKLKVKR